MDEKTKLTYNSKAGNLSFNIVEHQDIVKAFRAIIILEQQRIDMIKAEEKKLEEAEKLLRKELQ